MLFDREKNSEDYSQIFTFLRSIHIMHRQMPEHHVLLSNALLAQKRSFVDGDRSGPDSDLLFGDVLHLGLTITSLTLATLSMGSN